MRKVCFHYKKEKFERTSKLMHFLVVGSTPTWSIIPHFFRVILKSSHRKFLLFGIFAAWATESTTKKRISFEVLSKFSSALSFYRTNIYVMRVGCMMEVSSIQVLVGLGYKSLLLLAVERFQSANSLYFSAARQHMKDVININRIAQYLDVRYQYSKGIRFHCSKSAVNLLITSAYFKT